MVRALALWLFFFESVQSSRTHLAELAKAKVIANHTALHARDNPFGDFGDTANEEEGANQLGDFSAAMDYDGTALPSSQRGGICHPDCIFCCKKNAASSKKGFRCITVEGLACPRGRKCRNSYLTGSSKMSRFKTLNGVHQRVAMAAYWRFVWYTEAEMASKPKQFKCPRVNTWHDVFRVPFSEQRFQELKSKESFQALLGGKIQDGGWLPAPKVPQNAFQCPHACVECCSSSGGFMCVLRKQNVLPTGRDCKDPKKRVKADGFYANCKLTAVEKKLPSKLRKFPSCAKRYKCCCPNSDHWTEEVCMPLGTPQAILMPTYRGTDELFLAAPEGSLFENRGPSGCRKQYAFGNRGLRYDKPQPLGGCCVATVRYCCSMCDYGCCRFCFKCTKFEMIHTCSHDGGLTHTGSLFRRTASGQGTCMNNGPENNFTLFRQNNPDASGITRIVPVEGPKTKYKLAGTKSDCPMGTFQFGADKQECRCSSPVQACQSKLWGAIGRGAKDMYSFRRIVVK